MRTSPGINVKYPFPLERRLFVALHGKEFSQNVRLRNVRVQNLPKLGRQRHETRRIFHKIPIIFDSDNST